MKKYIFLALAFFSLYSSSVFAGTNDLYYVHYGDRLIYKFSPTDTGVGTAINAQQACSLALSKDGVSLYYVKLSDQTLWKKSVSDTSNGTQITTNTVSYCAFALSPDGTTILYVAGSGNVYSKSTSDTSNGSNTSLASVQYLTYSPDGTKVAFTKCTYMGCTINTASPSDLTTSITTTSVQADSVSYSPDGANILYSKHSDSRLYKKSSSDTSLGTAITTQPAFSITYSSDGVYVFYAGDTGSIYKKLLSDTSDGTSIGSPYTQSYYGMSIAYTPYVPPSETCSDGIKNQNETAIDYGGVCACYIKDIETGTSLYPFEYGGSWSYDTHAFVPFSGVDLWSTRNAYTVGSISDYRSVGDRMSNYHMKVTDDFATGSLQDLMTYSSGAFVKYAPGVSPTFRVYLYPAVTFGNEATTPIDTSGSNAINYVRLVTSKGWHLEAQPIQNYATISGTYLYDTQAWTRYESSGGIAMLPKGLFTRNFKIVFDDEAPIILLIEWGSYSRTVSSTTVCPSVYGPSGRPTNDSLVEINKILTQSGAINPSIGSGMTMTGTTMELYKQMLFSCPKELDKITYTGFSFFEFGFSFSIPLTDITIDLHPFRALSCPIKSILYIYNSF